MEAAETIALASSEQAIIVDEFVGYGEDKFIDREDIRPSKTNRKFFNLTKLQELAANLKLVGILQRILVRPVEPTEEEPQHFEIVYGERRWIAAGMAEINSIPCNVKTLSDDQAAMIQIFENLHKENPHPLEEAMGYQNLMFAHGYTAEALINELSVTRSYFYSRLKLCSLAADLHQDFMNDRFPASVALLIARIPVPELQLKAAKEVAPKTGNPDDEPMSARAAARFIRSRYTLDLQGVVFNIHDEKLLKEAGSCMKCEKRTGNQKEVFADISNEFLCTDPDCFAEKRAAHDAKVVAAATKKGIPVLEGEEGQDFMVNEHPAELDDSLYLFDRIKPNIEGNTGLHIEDLLDEKSLPQPIAYIKNDAGLVAPVFSQTAMQEALEKAGFCFTKEEEDASMAAEQASTHSSPAPTGKHVVKSPDYDAQVAARAQRDDQNRAICSKETTYRLALYKNVRHHGIAGFGIEALRVFMRSMVTDDNSYELHFLLQECYPFDISEDGFTQEALMNFIDSATIEQLQLLLVDYVLSGTVMADTWNMEEIGTETDMFNVVVAMAKAEGIDPDQVRAELEKPAAAAQPDEPVQEATKTPAKRGRKPKAAAQPQPDLITPGSDSGQPDPAEAKAPGPVDTPPVKTPGKRGPKPKQIETTSATKGTVAPNAGWPWPKG